MSPPSDCFGAKLKRLNVRIFSVAVQMGSCHLPAGSCLTFREELKKLGHRENEPPQHVSSIDHNSEVRYTSESSAGSLGLVEIVVWNTDVFFFRSFRSAATLYRDAHDLIRVGVSSDDIDPGRSTGAHSNPYLESQYSTSISPKSPVIFACRVLFLILI